MNYGKLSLNSFENAYSVTKRARLNCLMIFHYGRNCLMKPLKSNNAQNIYKGKTVLVTGHTGFKGSWLSHMVEKLGAKW